MNLNGINLKGYSSTEDSAQFELTGTDVKEVASLDGQLLTVTDDGGVEVEAFVGYSVAYIQVNDDVIRMRAVKVMDDTTAAAIESLSQQVRAVEAKAESAGSAAEEAKEIAQQAGANQQLVDLAKIVAPSMASAMSDEQALSVSDFFPEFEVGIGYRAKDVFRYGGRLFRVAQDHTSQAQWVPGDAGTESLYVEIEVAGDGIDVWKQPTGAHDCYNAGDKVHYPSNDSPVYVSLIDGNTWSPDTYPQGWALDSEAE